MIMMLTPRGWDTFDNETAVTERCLFGWRVTAALSHARGRVVLDWFAEYEPAETLMGRLRARGVSNHRVAIEDGRVRLIGTFSIADVLMDPAPEFDAHAGEEMYL